MASHTMLFEPTTTTHSTLRGNSVNSIGQFCQYSSVAFDSHLSFPLETCSMNDVISFQEL